MVTASGRLEYAKQSIACYQDQTYQNRNLLIVTDAPKDYQDDLKAITQDDPTIKLIGLKNKYTLGALRNISISLSDGEYFVQWDDDDFNMPDRMAVQYSEMKRHPEAQASYLSDQLHYYFPTKELYWEDWWQFSSGGNKKFGLIPGTGMVRRDKLEVRYPSSGQWCSAGEDSIFSNWLCQVDKRVLLIGGKGHLQIYSYHGSNVWAIDHHSEITKKRSLSCEFMLRNRSKICRTLHRMNWGTGIRVMGRDGLAFVYNGEEL